MLTAYDNSFEKYNIEDGNFATEEKVYKNQQETIEGYGVKLYENFYVEKALSNGSTLRIFKNREKVNKVCLMKGKMPKEIVCILQSGLGSFNRLNFNGLKIK